MSSRTALLRRVRPLKDDDDEEDAYNIMSDSSLGNDAIPKTDSEMEDDDSELGLNDEEEGEAGLDEEVTDDEDQLQEEDAQAALSTISFGALAKAQASLSRTSKAKLSSTVEDRGHSSIIAEYVKDETKRPSKDKADHLKASKKKTSKSAPTEMSSKRPVTRKREVVPVPSRNARDPRFDSAVGRVNEEQFSKNYAFLKDYQDSEISVLKEQIKKTKDERLREQLRAKLKPMESRKQTEESKRKAAELLREHKQKERELVKQGKKPYFLPRSEKRSIILMDKYSKLEGKELDRVIEKKRKRKATKERKNMPWARRAAD